MCELLMSLCSFKAASVLLGLHATLFIQFWETEIVLLVMIPLKLESFLQIR